jgi:hypothetical protein
MNEISIQLLFLSMVFLFAGFLGFLNYRIEINLIAKGLYKRHYNKTSDIKIGLLLLSIGLATGVSLYTTGQISTTANLGFFIPVFSGVTLIIATFVEIEEKKIKKKSR